MSFPTTEVNRLKRDLGRLRQIAQKSDEWLQQKRRILTATEIATLKNCHPFQTINQLYAKKCNPDSAEEPKDSEATLWGEKYEPIAKALAKDRHPDWVEILELGLAMHPTRTYLGASPDGLVVIRNGDQLELWLIEIKCLYRRQICEEVPYHYWLQMQTQLYVWTALLAELGWELKGCIYNENQFTEIDNTDGYELTRTWEHSIEFRSEFYTAEILPLIEQFWSWVKAYQRNRRRNLKRKREEAESQQCRKKRKSLGQEELMDDDLAEGLYISYLRETQIITQKQYRNWVNKDQLLDWLNYYGDSQGIPRDPPSKTDFKSYLGAQTSKLVELIYNHVQKSVPPLDYVRVSRSRPYYPENDSCHMYLNTHSMSYHDFSETINSMQQGVPVILNGYLYHPDLKTFGHYHMLVKINYLATLFPIAYKKLKESGLRFDPQSYTFIQIRYSKLKLCAKGIYLLNVGSQKNYKLEQAHLSEVLSYYQKETPSLLMGRKSTSTSKGQTSENYSSLASFGVIDFNERDRDHKEDFYSAREWLEELIREGSQWTIDPPCRDELYPNCKNAEDGLWGRYKKALAKKNQDLTLLWYVGQAERQRLWESGKRVRKWTDLDTNDLKYNPHIKSIIANMMESQMQNRVINMEVLGQKLIEVKSPIEFYLDFEFVSDLIDDFKTFPISTRDRYIYMVGNVVVNHNQNSKQYRNYLVNRLDKSQEHSMLQTFLQELNTLNGDLPSITIYHWGAAENTQLSHYLEAQKLLGDDGNSVIKKLKLVDLCELFKHCEVTIPDCFEYGLKDVARVFLQNGWIKTGWTDGLNGENAMVAAIEIELDCKSGKYATLNASPDMDKYIKYNYVDCKVMEEIVTFARHLGEVK